MNRELGADFDPKRFRHRAVYNEALGRVEIYLVSLEKQTVALRDIGLKVEFAEGEMIHTENSYKYDLGQLAALARETGFRSDKSWFDKPSWYSCNFWIAAG
jgi:L-histidine N-alpha-methyltransferase